MSTGKLIVLGLLALAFSCGGEQQPSAAKQEEERKFQLAVASAGVLKKLLRDPDSLFVEQATIGRGDATVCYRFRSRNGFGGMNRTRAILLVGTGVATFEEDRGFAAMWNKECAGRPEEDAELIRMALDRK